ncbi:hypothetical protein KZ774_01435 [Escherichia coli]|nr:hypothetical protein [Escherichia coli]
MKHAPVPVAALPLWRAASVPRAALALAELCYNTLLEEGEKSDACRRTACSDSGAGARD